MEARRRVTRAPRTAALLAGAAAALLLAGCAGGPGPEEVVEDFVQAAADKDYAAVCALLDPDFVSATEAEDGGSCEDVMRETAEADPSGSLIPDADKLELGEAEVDEDAGTASVPTTYDGNESAITLVRVDDEWKVTFAA